MQKKSMGMQIFLVLFFGPLGLLYSAPGLVIPFILGSFAVIALAAMADLGSSLGIPIILGIYGAPLILGINAVEKQNRAVMINDVTRRETEERRHNELIEATTTKAEQYANAATKACPFCAETVLAAAIKCKHCGSDIA